MTIHPAMARPATITILAHQSMNVWSPDIEAENAFQRCMRRALQIGGGVARGNSIVEDGKGRGGRLQRGKAGSPIGASAASVDKWFRTYREKGVEGLVRKSAHHSTRKLCDKLEKRIEEYRLEYPRKVSILLHEMTHGNQTRVPFVK